MIPITSVLVISQFEFGMSREHLVLVQITDPGQYVRRVKFANFSSPLWHGKSNKLALGRKLHGDCSKGGHFINLDVTNLGRGHTTQNLQGPGGVPRLQQIMKFGDLAGNILPPLDFEKRVPVVLGPGHLTGVDQIARLVRLCASHRVLRVTEKFSHFEIQSLWARSLGTQPTHPPCARENNLKYLLKVFFPF